MKQRFYVLMLFITGLSVTWCLSSKAHAGFEGIHKTIFLSHEGWRKYVSGL